MTDSNEKSIPILLWPFYALWRMVTFVFELIGRILSAILGIVFMFAGVAITLSVVGAPFGIPLAALGFLLLVRSLF